MSLTHLDRGNDALVLGTTRLRLRRLRVRDLAELQRELARARPDPLQAVLEHWPKLPEASREALLKAAYDELLRVERVSWADVEEYLATPSGFAQAIWLAAREAQADVTLEAVRNMVDGLLPDEFSRCVEAGWKALGLDSGNGEGQVSASTASSDVPGNKPSSS